MASKSVSTGIKKKVISGSRSGSGTVLSGDRVTVFDCVLANQLLSRSVGEMVGGRLSLSLYEACMLVEEKKLEVFDKAGEKMTLDELLSYAEGINENFRMKYEIFKDLRLARGYIAKPGIKFGCDFVVYARGKKPGSSHSKWMVHVMPESARLDYVEITRGARLAANVKKHMLFATVTERGPVYYEVSRTKM